LDERIRATLCSRIDSLPEISGLSCTLPNQYLSRTLSNILQLLFSIIPACGSSSDGDRRFFPIPIRNETANAVKALEKPKRRLNFVVVGVP